MKEMLDYFFSIAFRVQRKETHSSPNMMNHYSFILLAILNSTKCPTSQEPEFVKVGQ